MDWLFNVEYAKRKGLEESQLLSLQEVYKQLHQTLARPEMYCETPQDAVKVIEGFEYVLQSLWGFSFSKNHHSYWKELFNCTCPQMDNDDRIGTSYKILSGTCPYHSPINPAETWEDRRFE